MTGCAQQGSLANMFPLLAICKLTEHIFDSILLGSCQDCDRLVYMAFKIIPPRIEEAIQASFEETTNNIRLTLVKESVQKQREEDVQNLF